MLGSSRERLSWGRALPYPISAPLADARLARPGPQVLVSSPQLARSLQPPRSAKRLGDDVGPQALVKRHAVGVRLGVRGRHDHPFTVSDLRELGAG